MVVARINSSLIDRLEAFDAETEARPARYELAWRYGKELDRFAEATERVDARVTQLSSKQVALAWQDGGTWKATLSGAGLSPVGSLDALMEAIDTGVAKGDFDRLTLQKGKTTIASVDFDATGYTFASGKDSLRLTGSLPDSFDEMFRLAGLVEQLDGLEGMTQAQRSKLFSAFAEFGLTGMALSNGKAELLSFSITAKTLTLKVGGFAVKLDGTFPTDFGKLLSVAYEISMMEDSAGFDLNSVRGLGIDRLTFTSPEGTELIRVEQIDRTDVDRFDRIFLDGKLTGTNVLHTGDRPGDARNELFLGDGQAELFSGGGGRDVILGHGGDDRISGGKGNDMLDGGAGRDQLRGDAGADRLTGGKGNDTLTGGAGKDVFVFGKGSGSDRVTDYADGADRIEIGRGMAAGFDDLTITATAAGARIAAAGSTILLAGVSADLLTEADFLFV